MWGIDLLHTSSNAPSPAHHCLARRHCRVHTLSFTSPPRAAAAAAVAAAATDAAAATTSISVATTLVTALATVRLDAAAAAAVRLRSRTVSRRVALIAWSAACAQAVRALWPRSPTACHRPCSACSSFGPCVPCVCPTVRPASVRLPFAVCVFILARAQIQQCAGSWRPLDGVL